MLRIQFLDDAAQFIGRLIKPAANPDKVKYVWIGTPLGVLRLPVQAPASAAGLAEIGSRVVPAAGTSGRTAVAGGVAGLTDDAAHVAAPVNTTPQVAAALPPAAAAPAPAQQAYDYSAFRLPFG